MATDMRQYAERLAQAIPERFVLDDKHGIWALYVKSGIGRYIGLMETYNDGVKWAFWGPLGSEFGIKSLNQHLYKDQYDQHSGSGYYKFDDLLEAIADAVCQEAERRGKGK